MAESNSQGHYKTLLKSDEDFRPYLLGTFSSSEVALPVESFGVGTNRERTTFLILPSREVARPHWLRVYLKAIRPELLGLTLGHALVALFALKALWHESLEFSLVTLCLLATFFAHASACLFNDYYDHLNGTDRRSISHGSRVIQKAWSRAYEVRWWAIANACLSVTIGTYLLWGSWLIFGSLAALTAMAILFYSKMNTFWNRLGAGDFWITLLFGPLLFFSVWVSILTGHSSFSFPELDLALTGLALSLCFGLLASWTLQVRQFQDIFKREPGSFRTLVSRMNFDQAKIFLQLEGAVFFALHPIYFWFLWRESVLWLTLFFGFVVALFILTRIHQLASPLSSKMIHLSRKALLLHGGFLLLWTINLWLI